MITDTMGEARVFGQKLINLEASVQLKDRKANNTEGAVWQSAEELLARAAEPKNSAFLFLKPHAATPAAKALVETELAKRGIAITKQGELDGATIDSKKHIDKHYYSIASKATLLKPEKLPGMVAHAPKFEAKFGLSWADALTAGKVFNAEDACKQLSLDADGLDAKWAAAKKGGALVKFGGGFYCAELDGIYVLNGFFMAMRSKYTVPTAKIYYFAVEWEASECSWDSFRSKVLGPTDPAEAPADSLRGIIAAQWEMLGLPAACDVGDNGVHASASPFEALVERSNWLTTRMSADPFGAALIAAGVQERTLRAWSADPQVMPPDGAAAGMTASLFDLLEDMDAAACVEKCAAILRSTPSPVSSPRAAGAKQ